jgi:hypothetical protein
MGCPAEDVDPSTAMYIIEKLCDFFPLPIFLLIKKKLCDFFVLFFFTFLKITNTEKKKIMHLFSPKRIQIQN